MDDNDNESSGEAALRSGPARKTRLSFADRRAILEREQEAVLRARLEAHLSACDSFRKTVVAIVTTVSVLLTGLLGWLVTESYAMRGRDDGLSSRISSLELSITSIKDDLNNRATNIVAANISRESTFNERFKSLESETRALRQEFYNYQIDRREIDRREMERQRQR